MKPESQGKKQRTPIIFRDCITLSDGQKKLTDIFTYTILTATVASMAGVILFYAYSLASMYHGTATAPSLWLLGIFSDFVEVMNFSLKGNPYLYGAGSSYPPIAIAILYPFALICKDVFAQYSNLENIDINEMTSLVARHPEFWLALVLFFFVAMLSIVFLCTRILRLNPRDSIKVSLLVCFSAPSVYSIMRGNTIYFALVFVLLILLLYKSKNPVLREIAYISLAVAGSIKIYPLFFGVFLLKDKKIFASARVAVYFLLIFFGSFMLFSGNSEGANPFIDNLQGFMSDADRLISLKNLSLSSLVYKAVYVFSPTAASSSALGTVSLIILIAVFAVATFTAIITHSNLSRAIICASIIILIPSISYFYVLIFEVIPFLEFIRSYDEISKGKRMCYGAMFLFMMITPFMIPQVYIPYTLILVFMATSEEFGIIKNEFIPWIRSKRSVKAH